MGEPADRRTPGSRYSPGALLHRGVAVTAWELKTIVAQHPSVAIPLARMRGHGEVVTVDTDVVIEAFARSAQSFVVAAFRLAQEPRPMRIAHHTHSPSTLIDGVHRGIPALVIVREPEDAVISYLIRASTGTTRGALRGYVRFLRPLLPHRDRLVVATFDQVTNDLASAIRRMNERFGTSFALFDPTPANVARVFREIEEDERLRDRSDDERERAIPRPSAAREQLKAGMLAAYRDTKLRSIRSEAERLFRAMASEAGA